MTASPQIASPNKGPFRAAARPELPLDPTAVHTRIVVPVADLGPAARQALAFARAVASGRNVTAVHVTDRPEQAERFRTAWAACPRGNVQLEVIESPLRALKGPLLAYIDAVRAEHPEDTLMVLLPEYVPGRWWEHLLHGQTAPRLKAALLSHPGVVVANVPYHLGAA